jgi:hypothetical protein
MSPYWPYPSRAIRLLLVSTLSCVNVACLGAIYNWYYVRQLGTTVDLASQREAIQQGLLEWLWLSIACGMSALLCQLLLECCHPKIALRDYVLMLLALGIPFYLIATLFYAPFHLYYYAGIWVEYVYLFRLAPMLVAYPVFLLSNVAPIYRHPANSAKL